MTDFYVYTAILAGMTLYGLLKISQEQRIQEFLLLLRLAEIKRGEQLARPTKMTIIVDSFIIAAQDTIIFLAIFLAIIGLGVLLGLNAGNVAAGVFAVLVGVGALKFSFLVNELWVVTTSKFDYDGEMQRLRK